MRHLFQDVGGYQLAWSLFDALPQVLLLLDEERRVHAVNEAAETFLESTADDPLDRRFGDLVHCVNAMADYRGCGHAPGCDECQVRRSTEEALAGRAVTRIPVKMQRRRNGRDQELNLLVSASPLEVQGHRLAVMVMEEADQLRTLKDLIPICEGCGGIECEPAAWEPLRRYVADHPELHPKGHLCHRCGWEGHGT